MILYIIKYNQIYSSTQLSHSPSCFTTKRYVGELVPKNLSSFSRQVLTLTGRGSQFSTKTGLVPLIRPGTLLVSLNRPGTVLCRRPMLPYTIQSTRPHRHRIDYSVTLNEKEKILLDTAFEVLAKHSSEETKSEITTEENKNPVSPNDTEKILINSKNEPYTTSITENSTSDQFTKEEILQMCKDHDSVVKKNGKHPLTAEQIKQNIESQLKQQEKVKLKQQEKAKNKLKQTLKNPENPDKL